MRTPACVLVVLSFVLAIDSRPVHGRPVEILPEKKVADILAKMPPVWEPSLQSVLNDDDTMWYDRTVIIPGYQDSFGDHYYPIGFRPNTIQSGLIDGAVPGGHAQLFIRKGEFHFPFGRTGGIDDATNTFVVDFWRLPRESGKILPVVWWKHEPNGNTHRIEWMFPEGTIFGEVLFMTNPSGQAFPFEIRTRTRKIDGWTVDVWRQFPSAELFADALDNKRKEKTSWDTSTSITNLISHLRDPKTLVKGELKNSHYKNSFATVTGGVDTLPDVDDRSIIEDLLKEAPMRNAKWAVWKQSPTLTSYAASTKAPFSIVPKNYNATFFEVSDQFCNRCHEDAGRPFKDYYSNVIAYGELWGEDDTFSWHPFENKNFVDASGNVVSFNDDNRRFRADFVSAGLVTEYKPSTHGKSRYQKINHSWKNYKY